MADNGHKMLSQTSLVIISLGQANHRKNYAIMMVADALLPNRRQTICHHHADLLWLQRNIKLLGNIYP